MSLFTPGPPVIAGVDELLRVLTTEALKGVASPVGVTVGPLDRPGDDARLNWFLYRLEPAPAYANMEAPPSGWRTRRGRPPLALTLHYLLTADAGELSETGSEDDVVHAGLSALMSALHENGIFGATSPVATGPDRTLEDVAPALDGLLEPVRITLEQVPFETITAIWGSGSDAMRVSVAYVVSLVTVPAQAPFAAGPPVRTRRVGVAPSMAPEVTSVAPSTVHAGIDVAVRVRGVTDDHEVTLGRLPGDPDDPTDGRPPTQPHSTGPWRLTPTPAPDGLVVRLPDDALAPGPRVLVVTNLADGLPAGSGHALVTVVPTVVAVAAPLQTGAAATLTVQHPGDGGEAFFAGTPVPYTPVDATHVTAVVPPLPTAATVPVSLRAGTVAGPSTDLAVAP